MKKIVFLFTLVFSLSVVAFAADPATCDHQWMEKYRQEATPTLPGMIFYFCAHCSDEYMVEIPALYVLEETVDQTSGVSPEVAEIGKSFLSASWKMFNIYVPGFQFTFGQMYLGIALCSLSLTIAGFIFGVRFGGESSRTSSTDHPKISEKRRRDEF